MLDGWAELWIALKFFVLLQSKQHRRLVQAARRRCELLSNFLYFCSRNNWRCELLSFPCVVNCSQIFCTFAVETTAKRWWTLSVWLWIALKFFVLLQSKQRWKSLTLWATCCELLSNFLYFCSRNNIDYQWFKKKSVVNCSQIFCTFAVETTCALVTKPAVELWIALKFFVLLQSKQQRISASIPVARCELLSNFLYFCSRNNQAVEFRCPKVLWIALKFFVLLQSKQRGTFYFLQLSSCELLSNFLYFCSRNNLILVVVVFPRVVNCSQIFCTFAVETTVNVRCDLLRLLWIALKFFVLLQSKQLMDIKMSDIVSCELLSNFLYFCSRNNPDSLMMLGCFVVNCSQIFCTFAVETTSARWRRARSQLWIALKFFVLLQSKQLH